jgi:predicted ArsR family transcriptional regulator
MYEKESTNGGTETEDLLRDALKPVAAKRGDLLDERQQIKDQLDDKDAEIRRIDKVLRDAGMLEPVVRAAKMPNSSNSFGSDRMMDRVQNAVRGFEDPFTVREAADAVGVTEMTARKALNGLRMRGELRLVGTRPTSYAPHIKAIHYASTKEGV